MLHYITTLYSIASPVPNTPLFRFALSCPTRGGAGAAI